MSNEDGITRFEGIKRMIYCARIYHNGHVLFTRKSDDLEKLHITVHAYLDELPSGTYAHIINAANDDIILRVRKSALQE